LYPFCHNIDQLLSPFRVPKYRNLIKLSAL